MARDARHIIRCSHIIFLAWIMTYCLPGCASKHSIPPPASLPPSASAVTITLLTQYNSWRGTPHKTGGLSKKGVDCSGFVYLTFRYKFNIQLPRTTKEMATRGTGVSRNRLLPGDLVFFKTGLFKRHVGIYVQKNKFIHASTSRGVCMSELSNSYWSSNYWCARRILSN